MVNRGASRGGTAQSIGNLTKGGATFGKPEDYIGQKTIKDFIAYANLHIYDMSKPGGGNGREPYATSHDALDRDKAIQEEARNAARAFAKSVVELRAGRLQAVQPNLSRPRPKHAGIRRFAFPSHPFELSRRIGWT